LAVGALLFLAFFKVWFVMNEYMEVRHAILPLKVAMYVWLGLMWVALTVMLKKRGLLKTRGDSLRDWLGGVTRE
ncbi:MAG: hypothetical protein RID07_01355, partial [Lacipirellulaceae bacterium]